MGIDQDGTDENLRVINAQGYKIFSPVRISGILESYPFLWKQLHFEHASDLK